MIKLTFDPTNPPSAVEAIIREFINKNMEQTENIPVEKIKPFPRTIKKIDESDPYLQMLESSIAENGLKLPILINQNNVCLDGHRRLFILKKLGYSDAPIIKVNTDEYTGNLIYISM